MSFPEVEKVGSGTAKDAQVDPCKPQKQKFHVGFPRLKSKSCFFFRTSSGSRPGPKNSKNYPTSLPNGDQNALKTPPKTRPKNRCENNAKMSSKLSPKASQKPQTNFKKSIKIGPGAQETPFGRRGPHLGVPRSHCGAQNDDFWTFGGLFPFFWQFPRFVMSTATVFEEKENAATSNCFSDLSETRSLRSLSSNLDRTKKGTPNGKKKIAGVPPAPSVQCGVVRSHFSALPPETFGLIFGTSFFHHLGVHVNPKGGRRDPALRAE